MATNSTVRKNEWLNPEFWKAASVADIARHLAAGASIHARDENNATALHYAAYGLNIEAIKELLRLGADTEAVDEDDGQTPLYYALGRYPSEDQADTVALLLQEGGAEIDCQDRGGDTPLQLAVLFGLVDVVAVLIAAGADCNLASIHGYTPLQRAVSCGCAPYNADIVQLLLDAKADVHARDEWGMQPIHMAAGGGGGPEAIVAMLDAGADIDSPGMFDETPLFCAAGDQEDNEACVKTLIDRGANLDAVNDQGDTALESHQKMYKTRRRAKVEALLVSGRDGARQKAVPGLP